MSLHASSSKGVALAACSAIGLVQPRLRSAIDEACAVELSVRTMSLMEAHAHDGEVQQLACAAIACLAHVGDFLERLAEVSGEDAETIALVHLMRYDDKALAIMARTAAEAGKRAAARTKKAPHSIDDVGAAHGSPNCQVRALPSH